MPKLEVEGYGVFEVPQGVRLVRALTSNNVDILHRCGGQARCTTCRVEFLEGEPDTMTVAEKDKLAEKQGLGDYRLSCQILCDRDMRVRPLMAFEGSGLPSRGGEPDEQLTPPPEWTQRP